ncbi:dihydrouridine synthase family protein [Cryptosporidium muris RN66]|uniref:tRNA-dihydrouridine synthase n=1 Tax=Cryptosporidium muris (strain RN66) TaxID=441375 RepID=B6AGI9_CRYMR|nr:dihydrouridine synthase family protein [Cryptosporidium muris RN66]EEA07330.1 dihydrouridine synthase family protein [Cryptosporidium muris RN66]|eukprot:XP_002141679.1 dihydrouridine synthase family protein [Cryptosporidium muris RN66]
MDLHKKWILGPMVNFTNLPFRLTCLDYGADIVFTEEIMDFNILKTNRIFNEKSGIYEYTDDRNSVIFSTNQNENGKVIFQIGTFCSVNALKACEHIINDFCAFDINMGCPKLYNIRRGMGSALLLKPEIAEDILKCLNRNLPKCSITCKIRLLDDFKKTLDFIRLCSNCNISGITVHARTPKEKYDVFPHWDIFPLIKSELSSCIPVIANGDFSSASLINSFESKFPNAVDSFMLSRSARHDPSIFLQKLEWKQRVQGSIGDMKIDIITDKYDCIKKFLKYAIITNLPFKSTKNIIAYMKPVHCHSNALNKINGANSKHKLLDIFNNSNQ